MARFILSHRLAGKTSASAQNASRSKLEDSIGEIKTFASVNVASSRAKRKDSESKRLTLVVDSDPRDMENKRKELPDDLMIEQEVERRPASLTHGLTAFAASSGVTGIGASLELTITGQGSPIAGVSVNVILAGRSQGGSKAMSAETDASGKASITYDPTQWTPSVAIIVPRDSYWAMWHPNPQHQMAISLMPLPKSGPVAWWQWIMGINKLSNSYGEGIRIGIVDTGVGPHPYLTHVNMVGAFIDGKLDTSAKAGLDIEDHGTHVTGIIAARPEANSGDFMGIASGADVFVGRVYPSKAESADGSGTANQGDIANAIDELAINQQVDLINLSLGGPTPSQIELDAIVTALEHGALAICSAGNANGAPVMFPAAYPQTVSVSALGLIGAVPNGSLAAASLPRTPDRFSPLGVYLANFSNIGQEMTCTGPGVGIVSTVPARNGSDAPYADMSGTSMAAPAVCALLATLLSRDDYYRKCPRDLTRPLRAYTLLRQALYPLGLNPSYQGGGLPHALLAGPWN